MIAFAELLEAEGRSFRRATARTGAGLALTVLAALAAALGLALLLWALFRGLAVYWGATGAAVVTGVAALLVAGLLAWIAKRLVR